MIATVQARSEWYERLIAHRINPGIFFTAVVILSLNMTDACFTQLIIDHGGWEINPFAHAAMATFGSLFWVWKHVVVSLAVILLILHRHLRTARVCLATAACLFTGVTVWQLILIGSLRLFL
ncbi:MAG TPA: DUF5658 family protein [Syntrophales bacterium]|nr:DUF5658 family protein [Syntrophales bacterium]